MFAHYDADSDLMQLHLDPFADLGYGDSRFLTEIEIKVEAE